MTHPDIVDQRHGGETGEERLDGEAVAMIAADDRAARQLAAIQHSYEEAMAGILDLAGATGDTAPDVTDPHPKTEKIDVLRPPLSVVSEPTTPATSAMSLAAKSLAERQIVEGGNSPAASGPGADKDLASRENDVTDPESHAETPAVRRQPRRWWRPIRLAPLGADPRPR